MQHDWHNCKCQGRYDVPLAARGRELVEVTANLGVVTDAPERIDWSKVSKWRYASPAPKSALCPLSDIPAQAGEVVPPELCRLTFAVQHNPNCPSPWLVRLPGKGPIDMLPYGDPLRLVKHQTGDILGFGKTFEEAARAVLASTASEGSTDEA